MFTLIIEVDRAIKNPLPELAPGSGFWRSRTELKGDDLFSHYSFTHQYPAGLEVGLYLRPDDVLVYIGSVLSVFIPYKRVA